MPAMAKNILSSARFKLLWLCWQKIEQSSIGDLCFRVRVVIVAPNKKGFRLSEGETLLTWWGFRPSEGEISLTWWGFTVRRKGFIGVVSFQSVRRKDFTGMNFQTARMRDFTDVVRFQTFRRRDFTDVVRFQTVRRRDFTDVVRFQTVRRKDFTGVVSFQSVRRKDFTGVNFQTARRRDFIDVVRFQTVRCKDLTDVVSFQTGRRKDFTGVVRFQTQQERLHWRGEVSDWQNQRLHWRGEVSDCHQDRLHWGDEVSDCQKGRLHWHGEVVAAWLTVDMTTFTVAVCSFLFLLFLAVTRPPQKSFFHRLSVLGAHAVVDEDVEGGVDVAGDLQQPGQHEHGVLVAKPGSHFWHEEQHDPAQKQVEQEQPRKLKFLLSNKRGGGERPQLFWWRGNVELSHVRKKKPSCMILKPNLWVKKERKSDQLVCRAYLKYDPICGLVVAG